MGKYEIPGSTALRALVAPYLVEGAYPETHKLGDTELEPLSEKDRKLLAELYELVEEEKRVGVDGEMPASGSSWAMIRKRMCIKLREILESNPALISVDMVQKHAIDKGAIPDPDEDSRLRYFRMPDWNFACWACGSPIAAKEDKPYCPHCEPYEEFWPYGGQGEVLDDTALLLNSLAKRCAGCNRPTKNKYLKEGRCPVCRGVVDQEPGRTNYGTNGGIRCDTASGPCACGAWH